MKNAIPFVASIWVSVTHAPAKRLRLEDPHASARPRDGPQIIAYENPIDGHPRAIVNDTKHFGRVAMNDNTAREAPSLAKTAFYMPLPLLTARAINTNVYSETRLLARAAVSTAGVCGHVHSHPGWREDGRDHEYGDGWLRNKHANNERNHDGMMTNPLRGRHCCFQTFPF